MSLFSSLHVFVCLTVYFFGSYMYRDRGQPDGGPPKHLSLSTTAKCPRKLSRTGHLLKRHTQTELVSWTGNRSWQWENLLTQISYIFIQDKKNCGGLKLNSLPSISSHFNTWFPVWNCLGRARCAIVGKDLPLVGSSEVSKDFFDSQCSLCASSCGSSRCKHSAWHGDIPFNPSTQEVEDNLCEFSSNPVYIVSSRSTRMHSDI